MADFFVSSLMSELGLNTAKFSTNLKKAVSDLKTASKTMSGLWKKNVTPSIKNSENAMKDFNNTTRKAVKDISRVVTGILISQAFHNLLRTIKDVIKAVTDFSIEMEKAAIAFGQLLGSDTRAKEFLSALEDMAAVTPVQIEPLRQGAQQLLAMGFSAREVIPVLRTLTDTISAAGGGNEQLVKATQVFGKIRAMGKLSAREIRSLAVLNIPIQDILKEELELTEDQIRNIGALKIPAEKAITAILTGMDKRFSGLAEQMSRTLGGLISTIKDNLLFIGRDITAPLFEDIKARAEEFLVTVQGLREITKTQGAKGFFSAIFSPAVAKTLEIFVNSIKDVGRAVGDLLTAIKPLIKAVGVSFIAGLTAVAKALSIVVTALAELAKFALQNKVFVVLLSTAIAKLVISATVAAAVNLLAKAIAALKVASVAATWITSLSGAIKTLITFLTAHPIVAVITAVAVALLGLALSSEKVVQWFEKMKNKIAEVFGLTVENTDQMGDVSNEFGDWADQINNIGDEAEDAADQLEKFLAPFDELITIPDQAGLGDIDFSGIVGPVSEDIFDDSVFDQAIEKIDRFKLELEGMVIALPMFEWPPFPPSPVAELDTALLRISEAFQVAEEGIVVDWKAAWDSVAAIFNFNMGVISDKAIDTELELATIFKFATSMANLKGFIEESTNELTAGFGNWLLEAATFVTNLDTKFSEGWAKVKNTTTSTLGNLVLNFTVKTAEIKNGVDTFFDDLATAFEMLGVKEQLALSLENIRLQFFENNADIKLSVGVFLETLKSMFSMPLVKARLQESLDIMKGYWTENKENIITGFQELPERISEIISSIPDAIKTGIDNIFEAFDINLFSKIEDWFSGLGDMVSDAFGGAIDAMEEAVDNMPKSIFDILNAPAFGIDGNTPGFIPAPGVGVPIGIPAFANGGIINKDSLFRGGEGNRQEAVIPLQNTSAMKPFAEAVAAEMGGAEGGRPVMMVQTLVIDDTDLRKLNRRMEVVRVQEDKRRDI